MGLTDPASQTAGTNAQFVVNGVTMYSTSTTVSSTVSGLTGITLNLLQAQPGTTIQIKTQQDTTSIASAVKNVINNYNTLISDIDKQTNAQNKGPLAGQSQLTMLRNQIRTLFSSSIPSLSGTAYDSLQQIGITTASFAAGGQASPTISLDSAKLTDALTTDPSSVKKLFIGQDLGGALNGTAGDDGMNGVFTQVQHLLSDTTYIDSSGNTQYGALYNGGAGSQGLFAAYQTSVNSRIKALDDSIQKAQDRLEQKRQQLLQQFNHMGPTDWAIPATGQRR